MKILAWILGLALLVVAVIYFITPASSLPSFFPGYQVGMEKTHLKHGVASLFLSLAVFAFAWFQGGKKSGQENKA